LKFRRTLQNIPTSGEESKSADPRQPKCVRKRIQHAPFRIAEPTTGWIGAGVESRREEDRALIPSPSPTSRRSSLDPITFANSAGFGAKWLNLQSFKVSFRTKEYKILSLTLANR
jgi:hypothetical protein